MLWSPISTTTVDAKVIVTNDASCGCAMTEEVRLSLSPSGSAESEEISVG